MTTHSLINLLDIDDNAITEIIHLLPDDRSEAVAVLIAALALVIVSTDCTDESALAALRKTLDHVRAQPAPHHC